MSDSRGIDGAIGNFMPAITEAAKESNGFVLEIGVATGTGSTIAIQEGLVDHATPLHISVDQMDRMEIKPAVPWWTLVIGDSRHEQTYNVVKQMAGDRRPGLIFIDTDHSYEQVYRELERWGPIASDDTVWLFHDTYLWGAYNLMVDAIKKYATENNWLYEDVSTEPHGLGRMRRRRTFDEVWDQTNPIPGSFTRRSGEKLYEHAMQVPAGGQMVEVGVDQGRSASILMTCARARQARLTLVDSWESILIDNYHKVHDLIERRQCADIVTVFRGTSLQGAACYRQPIDLIHIDANHYEGIEQDCEAWLPLVKSGGIACFHDVESSFPAVTAAVRKYTGHWEDLGNWDGLAIRRKA